jgi:hypothetical protein
MRDGELCHQSGREESRRDGAVAVFSESRKD